MDATSYLLGKKAGGGSGTSNYNDLSNKPSINGVTLSGNKSTSDLGIEMPKTFLGKTSSYNTELTALNLNNLSKGVYILRHDSSNNKLWLKATYKGNQSEPTTRTLEFNLFEDVNETTGKINSKIILNEILLYIDDEIDESMTSLNKFGSLTMTFKDSIRGFVNNFKIIRLNSSYISISSNNFEDFSIQDKLISGTNIKTINNESILGSGNIDISGGGGNSYVIKGVDFGKTISNYNTAENRAVFKEIYDNYENITEKNVYFLDTTNDRYIQCSGIRLSGTQLRLYIDYTSLSQTNYYGVSYQPKTTVQLYGNYSNGGFSSIDKYDLSNFGLIDTNSILGMSNTTPYTPSGDYNPATKKYVDDKITSYTGYDATKTQVLKNVNGTLTWITEE